MSTFNATNGFFQNIIPQKATFLSIVGFIINLGVVFGPAIGYITQSIKFKRKGTSLGFCLSMCMKILLSNIFRIYFWFGKRFNIFLLFQSILTLTMQFLVIQCYIIFRDERELPKPYINDPKKTERQNKINHFFKEYFSYDRFWEWNTLLPFILYTILFIILMLLISLLFGFDNKIYMDIIGFISTGIDVVLAIPQIITNYQMKSADALSMIMFGCWLFGDLFKTVYYIVTNCPWQFPLCGFLQISVNLIIICQFFYYHEGPIDILQNEFFFEYGGGKPKLTIPKKDKSDVDTNNSYRTFDEEDKVERGEEVLITENRPLMTK